MFPRPDKFDPQRFDDEAASQHLIWPRGLHEGRATSTNRTCPGKDVAMLIGKLFCIALLTKFTWRLKDSPEWDRHRFRRKRRPSGGFTFCSFKKAVRSENWLSTIFPRSPPDHCSAP